MTSLVARDPALAVAATVAADADLALAVPAPQRVERDAERPRRLRRRVCLSPRHCLVELITRRGEAHSPGLSARNRLRGIVGEVKVEGLLAQVEIQVTEPARVVAIVTRESIEALGLEPGIEATAVVKATSVMVER